MICRLGEDGMMAWVFLRNRYEYGIEQRLSQGGFSPRLFLFAQEFGRFCQG